MISFSEALQLAIKDLNKPIISKFEIFSLALKISKDGSYQKQLIIKQRIPFGIEKTTKLVGQLFATRFISYDLDFKSYYKVTDEAIVHCNEVCCLVDPFCYISHLSAMQKYGLTNRIPEIVILTTATQKLWNQMKIDLEKKRLGNNLESWQYIPLRRAVFPKFIRKMKVKRIESKFLHPSIQIKDSHARISTIGYTFLDMLDRPDLCGGMPYVIDVWKEHAQLYLDEIINAVDKHSSKIIKARAGYIIDEVLNIKNKQVYQWLKFSQRGSSRLLDPSSPFASSFSAKWMISTNV